MKRMHLHVSVDSLEKSVGFYSTLFGAAPNVIKPDYAKWMLDDPRVNFAISARGAPPGVDHVGIQVADRDALAKLAGRLKTAGEATLDEVGATCCYAQSDKTWVTDPSGLRWETFASFGEATTYGEAAPEPTGEGPKSACCPPKPSETKACCG